MRLKNRQQRKIVSNTQEFRDFQKFSIKYNKIARIRVLRYNKMPKLKNFR